MMSHESHNFVIISLIFHNLTIKLIPLQFFHFSVQT